MKKKLLIFIGICLCLSGHAYATDVETLDNTIYIEPLTVTPGSQINISVKMKNTVVISNFTFDVYLPDGMSFVLNQDDTPGGSLNAERVPEGMFDLKSDVLPDNGARFQTSVPEAHFSDDPWFYGTDGEVMTFAVAVSGSMTIGNYTITLKNIEITNYATGGRASDLRKVELETAVTVAPAYITLDENSTSLPEAKTNVNVLVHRTIKAGNWSSICLPFNMTEEQCKAAFGDDVQLADFSSWTSEEDDNGDIVAISVGFTDVTAIEANHPYIIKVSSDIAEFTVDGTDIDPEDEPTKQVGTKKAERGYFIGTYQADTTVPEEDLFLSDNKFWYSTGLTKMKAFRGYFEFADVLTTAEGNAPQIYLVIGVAAGITEVERQAKMDDGVFYNLSGQRMERPGKGLYIRNGRKEVVK